MSKRKIAQIARPRPPHFVGDGFRVHNFIPGHPGLSMQAMDPFIMLDYNSPFYFPPSEKPRGVDVHPHRGFETVTIAYQGSVAHEDSSGGGGIIAEGDVQWMTAGGGILHKEFHEQNFSKNGGTFQMVQLWVNLPAKDKMTPPKYQAIKKADIPVVSLDNEAGELHLIAGAYKGVKGAASTFTDIHLYNLVLKPQAACELSFPEHFSTAILVVKGSLMINGEHEVPANHLVQFAKEGEDIELSTEEETLALIMSGEPIGEPIATRGPFVMNTQEELVQAVKDFQSGKFGVLN